MDENLHALISNRTILCYAETIYRFTGVWEGPNPLNPVLPLFIIQLTVAIAVTRLLVLAFKYFNQPPFVAEFLGGMLLGPSGFGSFTLNKLIFPTYGFLVLEPMAHLSVVLYAFLVGLDTDIKAVWRTGSKPMSVAVSGILIPFIIGVCFFFIYNDATRVIGCIFWGVALSATGFPVLTKLIEKQKILNTEIGRTAMASGLISDTFSWVSLVIALAVSSQGFNGHWTLMSTFAFVVFSIYVIRPGLAWVIRRTPEGQGYSEYYLCFILCGVWLCGVLTDVIGTHPMIGAFVFGLMIQNDVLESTLLERLEDFVLGFFMPSFFLVCGLRTNIHVITGDGVSWGIVIAGIIVFCAAKILSTVVVYFMYKLPIAEGVSVGVFANTKSAMVMIILEIGQQQGALSTRTFSIMVIAILVMTMIVTPITMIQKPTNNLIPYKRRTIQKSRQEEELRVLACIHGMRNVPAIISLLEASNANQTSPVSIFALQLVELVGRASAMLIVHDARKAGPRNPSHTEAQTEQIITAFDNLELRSDFITAQALTARSPYSNMDEDICTVARDKRAAIIILPFHKQHAVEGEMEEINPAIRGVNESVLNNAPCSVGILINRGLAESQNVVRNVVVLYFGGPDDREALSYAWRMSENSETSLTVVRFQPGKDMVEMDGSGYFSKTHDTVTLNIDIQREKLLDDDFLNMFKNAAANDNMKSYQDLVLNDEEEMIKAIKSMDMNRYDLYVVGKGRGMVSPLTAGLADWCDCPELGAIGDLLVTSEFESGFSVLVVQQYVKGMVGSKEGSIRSGSSSSMREEQRLAEQGLGSFSSHRGSIVHGD